MHIVNMTGNIFLPPIVCWEQSHVVSCGRHLLGRSWRWVIVCWRDGSSALKSVSQNEAARLTRAIGHIGSPGTIINAQSPLFGRQVCLAGRWGRVLRYLSCCNTCRGDQAAIEVDTGGKKGGGDKRDAYFQNHPRESQSSSLSLGF